MCDHIQGEELSFAAKVKWLEVRSRSEVFLNQSYQVCYVLVDLLLHVLKFFAWVLKSCQPKGIKLKRKLLTPAAILVRSWLCLSSFLSDSTFSRLGSNFMPIYHSDLVYIDLTPSIRRIWLGSLVTKWLGPILASEPTHNMNQQLFMLSQMAEKLTISFVYVCKLPVHVPWGYSADQPDFGEPSPEWALNMSQSVPRTKCLHGEDDEESNCQGSCNCSRVLAAWLDKLREGSHIGVSFISYTFGSD